MPPKRDVIPFAGRWGRRVRVAPSACAGLLFVEVRNADPYCGGEPVWFLCDGVAYDDYVCADPGDPWVPFARDGLPDAGDSGGE
jgi:hypothetical protein